MYTNARNMIDFRFNTQKTPNSSLKMKLHHEVRQYLIVGIDMKSGN